MTRDEAFARAIELGHALAADHPSWPAAGRWTCGNDRCGMAVIDYQGNVYGSATERRCGVWT